MDEDVGRAGLCLKRSTERFQNTGRRGADRHDTLGGIHGRGGRLTYREPFGVHAVLGNVVDLYRTEGADADVEGHECMRDGGEEIWGEVKTGGRCRDGAGLTSVYGLV